MVNRRLTRYLCVALAALLSACVAPPARVGFPGAISRNRETTIRVQIRDGSALVVRDVPLDEYVAGTALSELHPDVADANAAERMFEVQAVIARTYAVANRGRHARDGFDLCSTTHCQLYEPSRLATSRWAPAARDAVQATAGEIVWFVDAPALALFHADCGGHTSSASAVWGGPAPAYLSGEPDEGPAGRAHAVWTLETKTPALRAALDADPRTDVGPRLDRIDVAGRDAAGRAEQIVLRGARTFVVREIGRASVRARGQTPD